MNSGTILVDLSFGDCGKSRIVDYLAPEYEMVVKFNGGNNSGRTVVVNGQKTIFRLVPGGILHPHMTCVLAQGMVIDPFFLVEEMAKLEAQGISFKNRLWISDAAHLVLPCHQALDAEREADQALGTTKKGIGPAYEDKAGRRGLRVGDLFDGTTLKEKLAGLCLENTSSQAFLHLVERLEAVRWILAPYVTQTSNLINKALKQNQAVLFEGAQGTLLDIDHGTYPYVTSSSCIAGGACTGAGVGPTQIKEVIGLFKAYTTRVGNGPFLTELTGNLGEQIRQKGQEFGSVTGRPRRVGWVDLPALKYACQVNGVTQLVLTKLDVLSGLETIDLATGYEDSQGYVDTEYSPTKNFKSAVYCSRAGWSESISHCHKLTELPGEARDYVQSIEDELEIPIKLISVGPERSQMIVRN